MSAVSSPPAMPAGTARPRGRLRALIKRGLRSVLIALAALSLLGAIYEAFAERADRRAYPAPGQMVDVGGRNIHMLISGAATGSPTIILEAGVPGPYVVVGHSYGGLVVRAFADLYPDDVVGMALVGASHPDQWAEVPIPGAATLSGLFNRAQGALAGIGVVRLLGWNQILSAGLPAQQAGELEAALARPDAANLAGYADLLNAQQAELAALSSNSLRLVVDGATHESLVNEAGYARVVADGILRVVEAAETGEPLPGG